MMSNSAATKMPSIRYDELIAKLKAHDAARERRRAEELCKRGPVQIMSLQEARIRSRPAIPLATTSNKRATAVLWPVATPLTFPGTIQ
jgi:hypothetical protein